MKLHTSGEDYLKAILFFVKEIKVNSLKYRDYNTGGDRAKTKINNQ